MSEPFSMHTIFWNNHPCSW